MQDHVHAREGRCGVVHLLAVERQVQAGALLRLVMGLEKEGARAAGWIVDAHRRIGSASQTYDLGHHARYLGWRIELAFALARFGGEVAHEVLVGVAQKIVSLGSVPSKIDTLENSDELRQPVDHLLAFAEFLLVVEVGEVDGALQLFVGIG